MKNRNLITRREALASITGAGVATALSGCATASSATERSRAVAAENAKPGTSAWMLTNTRVDPAARYRCPWIEGFVSHSSIAAGERLKLYVSANPASRFTVDIFRMGYYGGAGARQVASLGPFEGTPLADPPQGPRRLRECRWEPAAEIRIPRDWLSGVYIGKLTAERGGLQSYVIFIVRDSRKADLIFQCSTHTWQAYNRWPNQFALYDDGKDQWYCGPDVAVSFDRPYGKYCQILDAPLSTGSGEWFLWEFPFAFWLEQHGYDVTYVANEDTHSGTVGLRRAKGFLSVGHDEYYTAEMYSHLRNAIQNGLSVGFFSGNTCCGRVELERSGQGAANRVFSRVDYFGPRDEGMIARFPSMAPFPHTSAHEGLLMGARNVPPCTGGADWICSTPDHWIYEGTGMRKADAIPGLIGWEFHGDPSPIPGLEVVATGPTQSAPGKPNGGTYTATVYPGPKGNVVFNASTCWWADGLSAPPGYVRPSVYTSPKGVDPRVQRITENVLKKMIRTQA